MRILTKLLFILILISCSTNTPRDYRSIASLDEISCIGMARDFIGKASDTSTYSKSLSAILLERNIIKRKYNRFADSVKQFNPHAHPPIKGSAKLVLDPAEGYLAKIMMIRKAKTSIDITYYIFKNDDASNALLHELRLAIKRGVKVRIMIDSLGAIEKAPFHSDIKALTKLKGGRIRDIHGNLTNERANIEAVLFNPVVNIKGHVQNWLRMSRNLFLKDGEKLPIISVAMNRRSHDKILMIDAHSTTNSMAIIGGRNIASYYYGFGKDASKTFQDMEIIVKSLFHKQENNTYENILNKYYNKIFYYLANKNFKDFLFGINLKEIKKQFKQMKQGADNLFKYDDSVVAKMTEMEDINYLNDGFDEGLISIVNELQNLTRTRAFLNPLGKHNKINGNSLVTKLRSQMENAQETIDIVSPYLWLTDEEIEFIKKWVSQDPNRKVRLISNSITTTDNIPAQAMVDTILGPKLTTELKDSPIGRQIEVYAYGKINDKVLEGSKSYGKLHGKFSIIDGKEIIVGTSNLDPRSRYLNTELAVAFKGLSENSNINKNINNYMDELVNNSCLWGSPEWNQIRNHQNNRISIMLQKFAGKIIHLFNLVPLI